MMLRSTESAATAIAKHFLLKDKCVRIFNKHKAKDIYIVRVESETYEGVLGTVAVFYVTGTASTAVLNAAKAVNNNKGFVILNCKGIIPSTEEPYDFREFLSPVKQAIHYAKHGHSKPIEGLLNLGTDY
jgi:hypothetical protein